MPHSYYTVEFLGLPQEHTENDLHRGLLDRMKDFMLELGRDFCFVGVMATIQVEMGHLESWTPIRAKRTLELFVFSMT